MKKIILGMIAICIAFIANILFQKTPESVGLSVTFLDVGQGDACVIECGGEYAMVDGGPTDASSVVYTYLKNHDIQHIKYMFASHPHEDHIGGLSGALNYAQVDQLFCSCDSYNSPSFKNLQKYASKQDLSIQVPSVHDKFSLGSALIEVIGPLVPNNNVNNECLILRITHGDNVFMFTADAERDEEQSLIDAGVSLSSTVLKVGHHGSRDATTYPFLRAIMPTYAVISCGADNSYGHPTEETLSRLRDANVRLFRTDLQGNITMESNGESLVLKTERNFDIDTIGSGNSAQGTYVLNKRTMKFHRPECERAQSISPANREEYTGDRLTLITQGYSPCGKCDP